MTVQQDPLRMVFGHRNQSNEGANEKPILTRFDLVQRVYENGHQYNIVGKSKTAIRNEWSKIGLDLINRVFEVIFKKGGHTKY